MRVGCALLFLFALTQCFEGDLEIDLDLTMFDEKIVQQFNRQIDKLKQPDRQRIISRIGKIAFFTRLIRRFARSPNVGQVDFEHFFPKPELAFHRKLFLNCRSDIVKCINFVFENIQARASFLFPIKGQTIDDFAISEENFNRLLTSSMFQLDVSVSYFFCFLARNDFELLRQVAFCSYDGAADSTKTMWHADRYKEQKERTELIAKPKEEIEAIDELSGWPDFQCADRSFCPNPCCGFNSSGMCSHPICRDAGPKMQCTLKRDLNDNLIGMVANVWNVSCECDKPGHVFRFDVESCVDVNECLEEELCNPGVHEECVNTIGSFKCVCQPGFIRRNGTNSQCEPIKLQPFEFAGPAKLNYSGRRAIISIYIVLLLLLNERVIVSCSSQVLPNE